MTAAAPSAVADQPGDARASASTFFPTERPPAAPRGAGGLHPHDRNATPRSVAASPASLEAGDAPEPPEGLGASLKRFRRPVRQIRPRPGFGARVRKSLKPCWHPPITDHGPVRPPQTPWFRTPASHSPASARPDTNAIVRQLVAIERLPIQSLQSRRGTEQRRLDLVGQLGDLVKTLPSRADDLSSPEVLRLHGVDLRRERGGDHDQLPRRGGDAHPGRPAPRGHRPLGLRRGHTRDVSLTAQAGGRSPSRSGPPTTRSRRPEQLLPGRLAGQIEDLTGGDVDASVVNTGTESSPSYQLVSPRTLRRGGTDLGHRLERRRDRRRGRHRAPDRLLRAGRERRRDERQQHHGGQRRHRGDRRLTVRRSTNSFSDVLVGITIDVRALTEAARRRSRSIPIGRPCAPRSTRS